MIFHCVSFILFGFIKLGSFAVLLQNPTCGLNQVYVACKQKACPSQYCPSTETYEINCTTEGPCEEGCVCEKYYFQNSTGSCVVFEQCFDLSKENDGEIRFDLFEIYGHANVSDEPDQSEGSTSQPFDFESSPIPDTDQIVMSAEESSTPSPYLDDEMNNTTEQEQNEFETTTNEWPDEEFTPGLLVPETQETTVTSHQETTMTSYQKTTVTSHQQDDTTPSSLSPNPYPRENVNLTQDRKFDESPDVMANPRPGTETRPLTLDPVSKPDLNPQQLPDQAPETFPPLAPDFRPALNPDFFPENPDNTMPEPNFNPDLFPDQKPEHIPKCPCLDPDYRPDLKSDDLPEWPDSSTCSHCPGLRPETDPGRWNRLQPDYIRRPVYRPGSHHPEASWKPHPKPGYKPWAHPKHNHKPKGHRKPHYPKPGHCPNTYPRAGSNCHKRNPTFTIPWFNIRFRHCYKFAWPRYPKYLYKLKFHPRFLKPKYHNHAVVHH